jgi:hypothetical protein
MGGDDNLQLNWGAGSWADNDGLQERDAVPAEDPLELASHSMSLLAVGDLGTVERTPVFHDGPFPIVESQAEVVVPNAPIVGENDVAVWAPAENEPGAELGSLAEPQLDVWKGVEHRNLLGF